jgi:acyl-coenzyme A thioesterase PaaI-like protein
MRHLALGTSGLSIADTRGRRLLPAADMRRSVAPMQIEDRPPEGFELIDWTSGFGTVAGPFYERRDAAGGGYARAFRVGPHQTNGMGNAHGGMLLTFADMAFGHAVRMQRNLWWVTVRLTCDFLSSARVGEWVEGCADVIAEQDDVFVVRGRVWVGDRTILTGQGLFKGIAPRD